MRQPISSRVLPALAAQVVSYAARKDIKSSSRAVELLVERGLLAMEDDSDEDLGRLLKVWRALTRPFRLQVLTMAQSALEVQANTKKTDEIM